MNMLLLKPAYIRVAVKLLLVVNFTNIYGSLSYSTECNVAGSSVSLSKDSGAGFFEFIFGSQERFIECNYNHGIDLKEEDAFEDVGAGKLRVRFTALGKAILCGDIEKIEEQINLGKADVRRRVILKGLEDAAANYLAPSESLDYLLELVGREGFEVSRYQDGFESIIRHLVKRVGYLNDEHIKYSIVSPDGSKEEVFPKSEYKGLSKICMAFLRECSRHRELWDTIKEELELAVKDNKPSKVRLLLEVGIGGPSIDHKAGIEEKDTDDWRTHPLHWAAGKGHKEVVKMLLARGAKINEKDKWGYTPLILAAVEGHKEIVEILLKMGAKIDKKGVRLLDGLTPLHVAAGVGRKEVVEMLIAQGAKIDEKNKSGETPLHWAAGGGHKEVVEMLLEKGAKIDEKNKSGHTPLYVAVFKGHKEVVEMLIAQGAEIDEKSKWDTTPLYVAAGEGHKEVVEILLEKGAKIDEKSKSASVGYPLNVSMEWISTPLIPSIELGSTPLHGAVGRGHKEIVEMLLEKGAKIDEKNTFGWTPLHDAALMGRKEIVEMLIAKGAKIDEKSNDGRTPLYVAAEKGHKEVIELLLVKGAVVNEKRYDGFTTLHVAAFKGHKEVAEMLLEKGAKIDEKSNDGRTPLYVAAEKGHKEVIELLLVKGAKPLSFLERCVIFLMRIVT